MCLIMFVCAFGDVFLCHWYWMLACVLEERMERKRVHNGWLGVE